MAAALHAVSGEHSRQSRLTHDPRHPHCPVPEGGTVVSTRANAHDLFKSWLSGGVQDLGGQWWWLFLDWLYAFLTVEEQDKLMGWHLG